MKFHIATFALLLLAGCSNGRHNADPVGANLNGNGLIIPDTRFEIEVDGRKVSVPMVSTFPLDEVHPEITRVIYIVPSGGHQLVEPFDTFTTMTREEGIGETTLIAGLQYLELPDITGDNLNSNLLYWDASNQWSSGDPAVGAASGDLSAEVSSFALIDSMWTKIIAACPNLETFIMTGNSAGGTSTHHFAAGTTFPERYPNIQFGFVTSNMVTIWYFTGERVIAGSEDQFAAPSSTEIEGCPGYDAYPTGMLNLNAYMGRYSESEIEDRYATRNLVYFIGTEDHTNYDDCRLLFEGEDNHLRNVIYYNYLQHLYGPGITDRQTLVEVPGATHDGVISDPEYRRAITRWNPAEPFTAG